MRAYLLENHARGVWPRATDVAKEFGVTRQTVASLRGAMVREGELSRAPRSRVAVLREEKARHGLSGSAMGVEERRVFLSDLARESDREDVKVQALSAMDRLEARLGQIQAVGHGPPMTRGEAEGRLGALSEAVRRIWPEGK